MFNVKLFTCNIYNCNFSLLTPESKVNCYTDLQETRSSIQI